jgi:hypothetical protein
MLLIVLNCSPEKYNHATLAVNHSFGNKSAGLNAQALRLPLGWSAPFFFCYYTLKLCMGIQIVTKVATLRECQMNLLRCNRTNLLA